MQSENTANQSFRYIFIAILKKFLIIDDHMVVRSGIKALLSDLYKPSTIDEAHDGESALKKIETEEYDLVLLDIQMPNTDTLALMQMISSTHQGIKVLIFSMSPENIYAQRYLKAGAMGYLNKDSSLDELIRAIDLVLKGKKYISETLLEILASSAGQEKNENPFNKLSPREFEITNLLLSGKTISQISNSLHLGVSTVGTHKSRIFEKLRVTNLLELKDLADSYQLGG